MANEAQPDVEAEGSFKYYTVADGTAIAKGSLMVVSVSADRTISKHSAVDEYFAGVATHEKEANDGRVKMTVQRRGYAKLTAGGNVTQGDMLVLDGTANKVITAGGNISHIGLLRIVGVALEDSTDGVKFLAKLGGYF